MIMVADKMREIFIQYICGGVRASRDSAWISVS